MSETTTCERLAAANINDEVGKHGMFLGTHGVSHMIPNGVLVGRYQNA